MTAVFTSSAGFDPVIAPFKPCAAGSAVEFTMYFESAPGVPMTFAGLDLISEVRKSVFDATAYEVLAVEGSDPGTVDFLIGADVTTACAGLTVHWGFKAAPVDVTLTKILAVGELPVLLYGVH